MQSLVGMYPKTCLLYTSESLGSSGDRRSQIQKRIAGLAGNRRLEAFSAQSLFQSIRTGRPVGDLNHFSFY